MLHIKNKYISVTPFLLILASLLYLLPGDSCIAQDSKIDILLNKISLAYTGQSYSGTWTFEEIENSEVKRKNIDENIILGPEKRWAKRIFPEGYYTDKEIVHIGSYYYERMIGTDSIRVTIEAPRRQILSNSDDIVLLKKNYDIEFICDAEVSGRPVDVVSVTPKNRDCPRIKIWVDKKNGFIYRLEKFDKDKNKIFQKYIDNIVFDPETDDSMFDFQFSGELPALAVRKELAGIDVIMDEAGFQAKLPDFIPPGFQLDKIQKIMPSSGRVILLMNYKDGLSSLSFFQERTDRENSDLKVVYKTLHGRRFFRGTSKNITYSIFGDLPEETMIKFFRNLKSMQKEEN